MVLALLFFSCRDGDGNPHPIMVCTVSIPINRNSHDNDFAPGRMKTFNSGRGQAGCYGGIVVLNINDEEFLAWDMACPNDHFYGCRVVVFSQLAQEMPVHFEGTLCRTRFNPLDGRPMAGSATRFVMRGYQVSPVAGRPGEFRVHN